MLSVVVYIRAFLLDSTVKDEEALISFVKVVSIPEPPNPALT